MLFNDPLLVLRQEPDGSLLTLAGYGGQGTPLFDGNPPGAILASNLTRTARCIFQTRAGNASLVLLATER